MSQHPIPAPATLLILRQNDQFTFVWQAAGESNQPCLAYRHLEAEQLHTLLKAMQQIVVAATYLTQDNVAKGRQTKAGNTAEVEEALRSLGRSLTHQLLPAPVQAYLQTLPVYSPFCLVTNDEFLPWELLSIDNTHLAMRYAISRQPLRRDAARTSRWNPPAQLHCLLIGNPTGDAALAAVDQEIDSLIDLFDGAPQAVKSTIWGYGVTKARLLHALADNRYDIIHFAGHARPGALLLADGWVEAAELQAAVTGAPFIFLNGCASAQSVGGSLPSRHSASDQPVAPLASSSLADAFLLGGASGFIGMLWPVLDSNARQLAVDFYRLTLQGLPVGEALRQARWRSRQQGAQQLVWAAPVLYGVPTQKLFTDKPRQQMGTVLVVEQPTPPMSQAEATACCAVIARYGGTVVTVTPTQLLALFGVTQPMEDDAERALRAVLALSVLPSAANQPNRTAAITSGVIGCNDTATASAGPHYWGEPLTLALQIVRQAHPGEVLVNESVRRLTQRLFQFELLSDSPFSSFANPFYRLQKTAVVELPPLLVERTRELADLHDHWQAAQQGEGRMLGVVGEAGIGKSALVEAFCNEPRNQPLRLLSLTANKIEQETPLAFLAALLRLLLGLSTDTDLAVARQQIEQKLNTLPAFAPIERLADYVVEVLGFSDALLTPEERKELRSRLVSLVDQLCGELAQADPLALIWDDAQYIDAESLALLTPLPVELKKKSVLLLLLYRPDWADNPWRDRRFYTQLNLHPLSGKGAQLLIQQLLEVETLPPALHQTLTQLQFLECNPLYLIDWLRYLQEERFLERVDGQWQVVRPLPVATLPESIKRSQLVRVHGLMAETLRPLLRLLAVVETGFTVRLLAEVLDAPDDTLRDRLNQLRKDELIDLSGSKPGERFSKVMREVLYDAIHPDERALLHRQVADALVSDPTANRFIVAGHYYRSKDRASAVRYALQAGATAADGWNNNDALLWYERAAEKVQALRERNPTPLEEKRGATAAALESWSRTGLEGQADVHARIGGNEQAIALYSNLLAIVQNLPPLSVLQHAELLRKLAIAQHNSSQLEQAQRTVDQGLALLAGMECVEKGRLLNWKSILAFRQADYSNALAISQQACAQLHHEPTDLAQARNLQCILYQRLGDLMAAMRAGEESVTNYRSLNHLLGLARALSNLGIVYLNLGRWSEALDCFLEGQRTCEKTGESRQYAATTMDIGEVYRRQGNLAQALACHEKARQQGEALAMPEIQGAALLNLGVVYLKLRQFSAAENMLTQCDQVLKEHHLNLYQAELLRSRAELALQQGQNAVARTLAKEAQQWAEQAGEDTEQALVQRVLGQIDRHEHNFAVAQANLAASLTYLQQQGNRYESAIVLLELAFLYADQRTSTSIPAERAAQQHLARTYCAEALDTFMTLGAQVDQEVAQQLQQHLFM